MTPYREAPNAPVDRDLLGLAWRPRAQPRPVTALAADGPVAAALLRRLLALPDASLAALCGVADGPHVVVLGAPDALPWVDGVRYLGRCAEAPTLTLPTALDPTLPPALVERALARRLGAPFALWTTTTDGTFACSLADARPLDRALLLKALGR